MSTSLPQCPPFAACLTASAERPVGALNPHRAGGMTFFAPGVLK